jgi:hypothetical protein
LCSSLTTAFPARSRRSYQARSRAISSDGLPVRVLGVLLPQLEPLLASGG